MNLRIDSVHGAWRYALVCLTTLVVGVLVGPIFTETQQRKDLPKVVILQPDIAANVSKTFYTTRFRQKLRDLGYVEGQNIVLTTFYAAATPERFSTLVTEVVRLVPDAIWTHSGRMASLVRQGITTVPVDPGNPAIRATAEHYRTLVKQESPESHEHRMRAYRKSREEAFEILKELWRLTEELEQR